MKLDSKLKNYKESGNNTKRKDSQGKSLKSVKSITTSLFF